MSGIFGGGGGGQSTVDPVAAGLRVQTSAYGLCLPLVYGRTRITANLIGYYDFTPIAHTTTQSSGGKGGGGASSSNTSWTYTASFMLGLCEGPISAVYSAWRDKDVLTQAQVNAIFTTFTGSYPQTPWSYLTSLHAAQAIGYQGVAYMAAANCDLGSSEALRNYSFEVGGKFSSNTTGTSVAISFTAPVVTPATVFPMGSKIRFTTAGSLPFGLGLGIDYSIANLNTSARFGGPFGGVLAPVRINPMSMLGIGISSAQVTSGTPQIVTYSAVINSTAHGLANDMLVNLSGAVPTPFQVGVDYYVVNVATNTLGLSATIGGAAIAATAGGSGYAFTVAHGGNPRDITIDVLIAQYGARFPSAKIGDLTIFSAFCVANNLFISPAYTDQKPAQEMLTDLMQITNAGVYFSEGLLKIVPLSDTNASGNGANYYAPNTPLYDLTDDDFIVSGGEPVKMLRNSTADAFNQVQVEFVNGLNQYNVEMAEARDQAAVETYGLLTKDPITAHAITDAATARTVAQMILQRSLYIRNTFEFTLSWKYCLLEPTDIVTITDADLGLNAYAVRIISVEEDSDGQLNIVAEDYPAGVSHSAVYPSTAGVGWSVNYNIAAGNVVTPAFYEVPVIKSKTGLAVGVAVTGNSPDWGGCQIWVSYDGTTYKKLGSINGGARYGVTSNSVTNAAGQVQNVTLAGNGGQLLAGSATDAANLSTLCLIEDEYVAHTGATLLSANNYGLTIANRGAYQTVAAAHAKGKKFIRIDNAVITSDDLDLSMIGNTLHFKFLSFNRYGGAIQTLGDVADYTYTITGVMAKLPPSDVTAITIQGGKVSWPTVPDPDVIGYRLKFQYGINSDWGTAGLIHNGEVTATPYTMNTMPSGVATIMVKAIDAFGNESVNVASQVVNFGQPITANIVSALDYKAASWPGVQINASIVGGNLQATQGSPFYSTNASSFYGLDLSVFYNNNYDALEWDSSVFTPPPMSVGGNLTASWNIAGAAVTIQYRIDGAEAFYQDNATYFYGATSSANFYSLPSAWMVWTGSVVTQSAGYQWKVTTVSGAVGGLLFSFTAQADLPTKNLTLNAIALSPSGTRLTGAIGYFNVISNIQLTLASGSTAVKLEIVDKSTTLGALVIAKDGTGIGVAATVDALIQGY